MNAHSSGTKMKLTDDAAVRSCHTFAVELRCAVSCVAAVLRRAIGLW